MILPVALLLVVAGIAGFVYARNVLLDQWREGAILKLERAAHYIDMRLGRPVQWIEIFHQALGRRDEAATREFVLAMLRDVEGVVDVELNWADGAGGQAPMPMRMHRGRPVGGGSMMHARRSVVAEVTPPRYDATRGEETVTLVSDLKDRQGALAGRLEVSVSFDYLMKDIEQFGWWQSRQVCLVDRGGRYLAHSRAMKGRTQLGETGDPVELAVLEKMQEEPFGTHMGEGYPPDLVSGFYRLHQAPWVLVMYAPGEEILAPVVEFRFYYAVAAAACIAFTLLFIQLVGGRIVRRIRNIAQSFRHVAEGHYNSRLPVTSKDEIGQLEAGFNEMVDGLKERDFIRDTFGRYVDKEIARELLKRPEAGQMGGQKREVVILMADIRGFTSISESLGPEAIIRLLNHYFSRVIEVIQKHRGIIVDFYGDGVLVFFDPHEGPLREAAGRALACSLEIQCRMAEVNRELKEENLAELQTGIGIHAGPVVVGNIGSAARAKYGIVGQAVNMTQRIQAEAGGGRIVVSDVIHGLLAGKLSVEASFPARLKGVNGTRTLHLLGSHLDL